jgi:acyl transferase domain-containing protein
VALDGGMLAAGLGAADALPYIEKYGGKVVVACHNSPSSVTLSGDAASIEQTREELSANNIFARVLKTGGRAYHSYQMADAAESYARFTDAAASAKPTLPRNENCHMISSVTGKSMKGYVPDDAYWSQNLISPVLFHQAVQNMLVFEPDVNLVVEIGPHSALSGPFRQICGDKKHISYLSSLLRNEDDAHQLLKLAGNLWLRDARINMDAVATVQTLSESGSITAKGGKLVVDLPPYQVHITSPSL